MWVSFVITHFAGLAQHTKVLVHRRRRHCNTDEKLPPGICCLPSSHFSSYSERFFAAPIAHRQLSVRAVPPGTTNNRPWISNDFQDELSHASNRFSRFTYGRKQWVQNSPIVAPQLCRISHERRENMNQIKFYRILLPCDMSKYYVFFIIYRRQLPTLGRQWFAVDSLSE